MLNEFYNGWRIKAYRQHHWPPYLDFVAHATRKENGVIVGFNVEGNTLSEAIQKAMNEIDSRD